MTDERRRLFDTCPPAWRVWCGRGCAVLGECHGCVLRHVSTMRRVAALSGMPAPAMPTRAEFDAWQEARLTVAVE